MYALNLGVRFMIAGKTTVKYFKYFLEAVQLI